MRPAVRVIEDVRVDSSQRMAIAEMKAVTGVYGALRVADGTSATMTRTAVSCGDFLTSTYRTHVLPATAGGRWRAVA